MPEKTVSKASKKVKDKWRTKEWYTISAPVMFERAKIGETLTDDPGKLMGRIIEVTAQDLTGDFTKMHIKLHFKVGEIKEKEATTFFLKQDLTSDYIRRLARRKRTRTEETYDLTLRDGAKVRVRSVAISEQRIQSSKQTSIRKAMQDELKKVAAEATLTTFVKDVISGQIPKRLGHACKNINMISRVEIKKTEFRGSVPVETPAPEAEVPSAQPVPPPPEELPAPEELPPPPEVIPPDEGQ